MKKPDGLSRRSGKEKLGMDAKYFNEGQLPDSKNDNVDLEEDKEDVDLEGIDVAT